MDDFFNHEYADEVFERVSKMDDDTAQMFTLMVAHDVLHRDLDNNRETVSKKVTEILNIIHKSVLNVADDEEIIKAAPLIEEISKAPALNTANYQRTEQTENWSNNQQRRVARIGGRFASTGAGNKQRGNPNVKVKYTYKGPAGAPASQVPRWAEGLPQTGQGDLDVTAALGAAGGRTNAFEQAWNNPNYQRGTNERTYNRLAEGSRLVSQVGTVVGGPTGGAVAAAGQLGEYAGRFGPSAEKVVGPSMRRTAYRYRGTEREVEAPLKTAIRQEIASQMRDQGTQRAPLTPAQVRQIDRQAQALAREDRSKTFSEHRKELYQSAAGAQKLQRTPLSPEQRMEVSRGVAVRHLSEKLPSSSLAALQVASGKIPPSEGVIIDANGHVVTQAVGYQEDHFLPFNLKNLKALQGGSYVRTRSSGGLTSEDIYTGLMSGARSMTVVSRSGTFTIDFADDLRGQRRYGDVARQMVNRYEKTLDAVQSRTLERSGLDPSERAQIRADIEREYSAYKDTEDGRRLIEEKVKDAIDNARRSTDLSLNEIREIDQQAMEQMEMNLVPTKGGERIPTEPGAKYQYIRNALIEQKKAEKENRMLQLDGVGYETAMRALQEQYPYFIANVRAETYKDPENRIPASRETDQGYVRANYLRPKAVREGYFDPEIEGFTGADGTGKYSAASTNYQNWGNRPRGTTPDPAAATDTDSPTESATEGTATSTPTQTKGATGKQDVLGDLDRAARVQEQIDGRMADAILIMAAATKPHQAPTIHELLGDASPSGENARKTVMQNLRGKNPSMFKEDIDRIAADLRDASQDTTGAYTEQQKRDFAGYLRNLERAGEEINLLESSMRAGAKNAAAQDNFTASPMVPFRYQEFEGKGHQELNQLIDQNPMKDLFGVDDAQLRTSSDNSLKLEAIYRKIGDGTASTTEIIDGQRIVTNDPQLSAIERDRYRRAVTDPKEASLLAGVHRKRANDIERLRTIQDLLNKPESELRPRPLW